MNSRNFIISLILVMYSVAASCQSLNFMKFEFIGAASKPVFPIYAISEESSLAIFSDIERLNRDFHKIILDNYTFILSENDYAKLISIVNEIADSTCILHTDESTFNIFLITIYENDTVRTVVFSRFNECVGNFYLQLYNKLKNQHLSERLTHAVNSHLKFIEEQIIGRQLIRE